MSNEDGKGENVLYMKKDVKAILEFTTKFRLKVPANH